MTYLRPLFDDFILAARHWWSVALASFLIAFCVSFVVSGGIPCASADQGRNHGNDRAESRLSPSLSIAPKLLCKDELWRVSAVPALPCGQIAITHFGNLCPIGFGELINDGLPSGSIACLLDPLFKPAIINHGQHHTREATA